MFVISPGLRSVVIGRHGEEPGREVGRLDDDVRLVLAERVVAESDLVFLGTDDADRAVRQRAAHGLQAVLDRLAVALHVRLVENHQERLAGVDDRVAVDVEPETELADDRTLEGRERLVGRRDRQLLDLVAVVVQGHRGVASEQGCR